MTTGLSKLSKIAAAILITSVTLNAFAADLLDTVRARGTLKVAMEDNYPPFNFKDPKSGELTVFEVDVAKLLAAKLGVKPEFTTTEWSGMLAGLGAGKYDVILNQVGITAARQRLSFSRSLTRFAARS